MAAKDDLGRRGEALAVDYLQAEGLSIIETNWRCSIGEIDIVARDGGETVFVEVKTRAGTGYGHPLEAITGQKVARLRRLAAAWFAQHPDVVGDARIDAVAVIAPAGGPVSVEHLRGAI